MIEKFREAPDVSFFCVVTMLLSLIGIDSLGKLGGGLSVSSLIICSP